MANYNLNQFRNTYILTDQTGSLFDSGGPTGSYSSGQNYYVLIAPNNTTGTLTLNVVSGVIDANDALRIYNGIPNTSSYSGLATNGTLLAVLSGTLTPQTITASAGRAYIRFGSRTSTNTVGTIGGFQLDWTGSGIQTVDSSSGVIRNQYAATFPLESYLTFAPGRITGSSTLTGSKDIVLGFWARYDYDATDPLRGLITIGDAGASNQGLVVNKVSTTNDLRIVYRDSNGNANLFTATNMLQGGGTGAPTTAKLVPQWHHYGWAIRRTSTTGYNVAAYLDGTLFASSSATFGSVHGNITSSLTTVLGQYRTAGVISAGQSWSGSFDDVFLGTLDAATPANHASFFSAIFNSGNWSDPTEKITGSYYSGKNGAVVFNWRFEETGSMLNTRDWGSYGNIHSASTMVTGGGNVFLTATGSGQSYTPYGTLAYSASAIPVEPGTFNWQSPTLVTYETASQATINIIRTSGSYGAVTANLYYTAVTGTFPAPSGSAGTASFIDGQTTAQAVFDISDDLIDDVNKVALITFSSFTVEGGTAKTGSQGTLTLTIIDNETGSVTFNTGSATIYENTSSYIFNLQRLYGGDQPETASISYAGTAIENTQYNVIYNGITQSSPFNVYWTDQQKDTRYITASIYDNNVLDGTRNIIFGIASSSISAIGPTSSFQLNVLDYEITGSGRFITSSYTGTIPSVINIQVERYDGQDVTASAVISTNGGTAVAGADYTNIFPYTVNWANQESGSKTISIETLSSWGSSKTLDLRISSLTNLSTGTIMSASILFVSTVYTQSSNQYSDYATDFTINKYLNLSNHYTRRTQQVPFSLGTNPLVRLQQAYSSST